MSNVTECNCALHRVLGTTKSIDALPLRGKQLLRLLNAHASEIPNDNVTALALIALATTILVGNVGPLAMGDVTGLFVDQWRNAEGLYVAHKIAGQQSEDDQDLLMLRHAPIEQMH